MCPIHRKYFTIRTPRSAFPAALRAIEPNQPLAYLHQVAQPTMLAAQAGYSARAYLVLSARWLGEHRILYLTRLLLATHPSREVSIESTATIPFEFADT